MKKEDNEKLKLIQSRKWLFTCNNPEDHGWSIEKIVAILENWKGIVYWCIGKEVGVENHTPHIHFFVYGTSPIKASTIENKFHGINRQQANGTIMECRNYVFKEGVYLNTEKGKLHDYDSNQESGEPPEEKGRGHRTDMDTLYTLVKENKSTYEILEMFPQYIECIDKIDKVRQIVREEEFKNKWRTLHVTYIWGVTGSGKTRSIMEKYGYENVYRVTDYAHPFDAYKGQDVVIFEEFRSSLRLDDMLKYLDGYPVEFPARYNNKVACFTKVYIITNIDIRDQYPNCQSDESMSWKAFLRRIHEIQVFTGKTVETFTTEDYFEGQWHFFINSPFDKETDCVSKYKVQ